MIDRTPKPGEFYRHFKNKMYQIVAIAKHSETKEPLVIYQALYDDFGIYARPLEMFVSEVDHVKYPDVKQKYRFEKIDVNAEIDKVDTQDLCEVDDTNNANSIGNASGINNAQNDLAEEGMPDPKLMEFLDADTFEEKYNVLVSMRDCISDKLVDDIAVVMDVVIPDGDLMKRYDDLKQAVRTRQHYEFSNRLR